MQFLKVLFFCFICNIANAQNINGKLSDTATNSDVTNTVICLIKVKDSSLIAFTRVKTNGTFTMPKPTDGKYVILISNPKYFDFLDTITIANKTTDVGNYFIKTKSKMMEDVIVRAKVSPIKIKGDTIIYTADSFKVREGANVEDLLKKLPGITIGRNGEITAMGQSVKKVLVDGEEFFGSDPGIVTKNLQANAVDKVEVFDKKSDQAAFTGIDDGVKDKTINLKLKDSKKNGYFGKLEASGGTPSNFDMQAMINAFKNKRKIAAFGMAGNIGNTSLGWEDNQSYGNNDGSENTRWEDGGMYYSSNNGDEFSGFYGGRGGIPQNWNAGAHYSNKFNNDKQTVNFGYKYNKVNALAQNRNYGKTFLPDTSWNDNSNSNAFSSKNRNKINLSIETKLDSFNIVKFTLNAHEQNSNTNNNSFSESFSGANAINNSNRFTTNDAKGKNLAATALWMRKFKKLNRSLSLNVSNTINNNESEGSLLSYNNIYKAGIIFKRDTIDQLKINTSQSSVWTSRISYTEPLTKKITAEVNYSLNYNANDNNRQSLNKDANGKYNVLATDFSNNFEFRTTVQTPGVSFKYDHKKIKGSIGTRVGLNKFNQKNVTNNTTTKYNFTNIFPTANFNIKMKGNSNLGLNYNGSGIAPTLNQLQPIQDNSNPFYIVTGNPNLKQSFTHRVSGNYNMWNVIKNKNIYSYFNFAKQQNAYTTDARVDTFGRTISKTVNVNGNYNMYFGFNYGFKIKSIGLDIEFGPNGSFNNNNGFVNGIINNSKSNSYGINTHFSKWVENKAGDNLFGFGVRNSFTQNKNKSTINQSSAANFKMASGASYINVAITKKLNLNTELEYESRQKDARFTQNNNFALWNSELNYEIKKNVFNLNFKVKDLLNQNRGFSRNFTSYNYNESYFNTLKRYWLLTATYKFNSQKLKSTKNAK